MPRIPKYIIETDPRTPQPSSLTPVRLRPGLGQLDVTGGTLLTPAPLQSARQFPERTPDLVGPAIEDTGALLGRAALAFENSRAELHANDAVIEYKDRLRRAWLGAEDAQGAFKPGYASTTGKSSLEGLTSYNETILDIRDSTISGLKETYGENAASRFLYKTQAINANYLDMGAQHAASGKKVWETLQLADQAQQLSIELADEGLKPQTVNAMLVNHAANITALRGEAAAGPIIQSYYKQHGSFLVEQPGGLQKLSVFKSVTKGKADQDTTTHLNSLIRALTRRELTDQRQVEADASRRMTKLRDRNGLDLRTKLWRGDVTSETDLHNMLRRGEITAPTHDYLIFAQREGTVVPALLGNDSYRYKSDILFDRMASTDIDNLRLNSQDNRMLHSYLNSVQAQEVNSDLRAIRSTIERIGKHPLYFGGQGAILSATEKAESLYLDSQADKKPLTPYEVVQRAGVNYFKDEIMRQQAPPPLQVLGETIVPESEEQAKSLYLRWRVLSDNLDEETRTEQENLFLLWKNKFSADQNTLDQRARQLEETTQ